MNEWKIKKQTRCIRTKFGQVKEKYNYPKYVILGVRTACFKNNVTVLKIYE